MKKRRIFVSHARSDREWVRAFAEALTAQGVEVWLDELQLQAGERLEQAMEQGFRDSDVIAFVITPDNVRGPKMQQLGAVFSKWRMFEKDTLPGSFVDDGDILGQSVSWHELVDLTLRHKAKELGANAVINMKIRTFKNGAEGSGDAVRLEQEEKAPSKP